jgi:hypothetical protein
LKWFIILLLFEWFGFFSRYLHRMGKNALHRFLRDLSSLNLIFIVKDENIWKAFWVQ